MAKKGIESNMVGKKKKETGQISINTHKKILKKKKKKDMIQHEDHIFSLTYPLLICSTTTKLYPLSQLTPIKKDKIKKKK